MNFEGALRRVSAVLTEFRHRWALVGGFAVSARSTPRFTRDVDLAVAVEDDTAAEELLHHMLSSRYELMAAIEQDSVGRLATARLIDRDPDFNGLVIDLLFASSGIESEIAKRADNLEILPGLIVPVASVGHLIALKLLAHNDETRPQDRVDLIALREVAVPADLELARESVELIHRRGYQRDRDLLADYEAFVAK